MTTKQLIRIGLALIAVIFLWGLAALVRGGGDEIERAALFGPYVEEQIDQIEIGSDSVAIRLVRAGADWTVNGFDADRDRVRTFFQQMAVPVEGELVARSASSHERMGVDDSAGKPFRVLQGGQPVADLLIGTSGRAYRSVYIRRADQDPVYRIEGEVTSAFSRAVKDWRDKRIVTITADQIGAIDFARGDTAFGIRATDQGWVFQNGAPTDSATVDTFLKKFSPLVTQGDMFATPAQIDSISFEPHDRRLTIRDGDGDTIADLLFVETESGSGYWVRQADGDKVFQLMTYRANEIVPLDNVFQPKEGATPN